MLDRERFFSRTVKGVFFMENFLSIFSVIDNDASPKFIWVTVISLVLLALILVVISFKNNQFTTKCIVYAGLTIATSFALSYVKVSPVLYGGSITLCSMLPICVFSYAFGFVPALLTGLIYGLLQFIQNPYIFTYSTILLDFLLAFSSIALMPLGKLLVKNEKWQVILGILLVYLARFTFHFLSGLIYFDNGGIWANLPQDNAFIYSFLYNVVYLIPDLILNLVILIPLTVSGQFKRLINAIK